MLQLGLAGLASGLKDARLEVAGGIVEAADCAQHTIRLEELLDQERAEKSELEQRVSLAPSPLLPLLASLPLPSSHALTR